MLTTRTWLQKTHDRHPERCLRLPRAQNEARRPGLEAILISTRSGLSATAVRRMHRRPELWVLGNFSVPQRLRRSRLRVLGCTPSQGLAGRDLR
jgi:hypothetical protein